MFSVSGAYSVDFTYFILPFNNHADDEALNLILAIIDELMFGSEREIDGVALRDVLRHRKFLLLLPPGRHPELYAINLRCAGML